VLGEEMKILITGAAGMLGSSLCPILKQKGHEVYATDINTTDKGIEYLDVRNFEKVHTFMERVKPDMVMHLAAETDVDKCELEPDHAYLTNTIGTQNVALVCQKYDIEMVYISTIGVFDGEKSEPYTEFDEPNPINVYGKSKLWGERVIQSLLRKYYIVRAGWMMGGGPEKDKKFVAKIIRLLDKTSKLKVVNDKFGSPTYTLDLSKCLSKLIETEYYGLYHCTNRGFTSRYEIAKRIMEYLGRNDVTLQPVSSAYFPLPAPRARSETSRNYKLELLGIDSVRHWEEALKEYLENCWRERT
jgi:dTDP-4-dehydrorhamnose reductase